MVVLSARRRSLASRSLKGVVRRYVGSRASRALGVHSATPSILSVVLSLLPLTVAVVRLNAESLFPSHATDPQPT